MHLDGFDIGSMNHSAKFIEGFVDNMAVVMDKRIRDHIHGIDHATCRKRLFAFAADKFIELQKTVDAIGMLIMMEGELKSLFIDYLLITRHTSHALMSDIYQEKFIKNLGLSPKEIRH
jgi:hypothetical protein